MYAQDNVKMKKAEMKKICDKVVVCAKNYDDMLEIIKTKRYYGVNSKYYFNLSIDNISEIEEVKSKWNSFIIYNYYDLANFSENPRTYSVAMKYDGDIFLLQGFPQNDFDILVEACIKQIQTKEDALDLAKLYLYTVKNHSDKEIFIDSTNISKYNKLFRQQLNSDSCEEKEEKFIIQIWSVYNPAGYSLPSSLFASRHKLEISREGKILKYKADSIPMTDKSHPAHIQ